MFLMFPHAGYGTRSTEIHVVDETGRLRVAVPSVEYALRWLWGRGHRQIGSPAGREIDVFLIEPEPALEDRPQAFTLRRDPHGKADGEALQSGLGKTRLAEIARAMQLPHGRNAERR